MSSLAGQSNSSTSNSPRLSRWHRRQNWIASSTSAGDISGPTGPSSSASPTASATPNTPAARSQVNSQESDTTEPSFLKSDPATVKEKKDKNKDAWFSSLYYPTYKSRSDDFKRVFKDVPSDERLIVDYPCTLQQDKIVHGRIYVTQNFLCFYGNVLRWEQLITIRWKEVTALAKEKTALVLPNALLVSTQNEKHFFTSFGARDKAYLMLFRVWQNALMGQQMPLQEVWQWVHSSYGEQLGLSSDDDDYFDPEDKETMVVSKSTMPGGSPTPTPPPPPPPLAEVDGDPNSPNSSAEVSSTTASAVTITATATATEMTLMSESPLPTVSAALPVASSTPSGSQQEAHLDTDMSDTTESEPDKGLGSPGPASSLGECSSPHEGREMLRMVLPVPVDHLFTLLFTDNKFFTDFHSQRNATNIRQTSWERNSSSKEKQRTLNFDIVINQGIVGRKTSQITETQAMRSKPGKMYIVDAESSHTGFPYADSFYVTAHFCLKRKSDSEAFLNVYVDIKFKKPVWVMKNFIEKHTWVGLEEHYSVLSKALTTECGAVADGLDCRPLVKDAIKPRRRLRSAPRRKSTAQRLSEEVIVPHIVRPVGRKSLTRGSVGSPDRRYEAGGISSSRVPKPLDSAKAVRTDTLNYVVLAVLVVLMLLNAVLYYKLWALEQWSLTDPLGAGLHSDLTSFKQNPPKSHEEWMQLLRKQESLHSMEVNKWHKVLRSAVILLKKTEESLKELQVSIQPRISRKFTPSQHSDLQ